MSGLTEIFEKIARGSQNMTADEQPIRGHRYVNLAMVDGKGGSWTQLYECACGQVYVASRAPRKGSKKQPILATVVDTDCTFEHPVAVSQ